MALTLTLFLTPFYGCFSMNESSRRFCISHPMNGGRWELVWKFAFLSKVSFSVGGRWESASRLAFPPGHDDRYLTVSFELAFLTMRTSGLNITPTTCSRELVSSKSYKYFYLLPKEPESTLSI